MKNTRPIMIGAALLALAVSAPASAQVYLGAGPGGIGVGVGDPYYHDYGWRHRHWRDDYAYSGDCRVVRKRIVTPSGRVIYRTHRDCY